MAILIQCSKDDVHISMRIIDKNLYDQIRKNKHEKGNTPEDQLEKLEIAYRKWGMSQKDETTNPDKTYEDFMETCEKVFTH